MYSFLFPCETFNIKKVDDHFKAEHDLFKSEGFNVALIDLEDNIVSGTFENHVFIYRGWMLSESEYDLMETLILGKDCTLLTNKESYYESHHLFRQYSNLNKEGISAYSPETHFCKEEDVEGLANDIGWDKFFVKDFVKSLTTDRGSIANSKEDVLEIVEQIKYYRGSIEGGVSLRKVEDFIDDTEVRYFVLDSVVYSPNGKFHEITKKINSIHKEKFFSLDIILDTSGKEWIVEIGDGQVSDLAGKGWDTKDFVEIFKQD
jgi:hypothetical protein